jgi:hypothetical protein
MNFDERGMVCRRWRGPSSIARSISTKQIDIPPLLKAWSQVTLPECFERKNVGQHVARFVAQLSLGGSWITFTLPGTQI